MPPSDAEKLTPAHVLAVIAAHVAEWPALVGAEWPAIEARFHELRTRLETTTGPAQMLAAAELTQLLAPHPGARQRLSQALTAQTEMGAALHALAGLADQLGLDPTVSAAFTAAAQPDSPQRVIWQASPTRAYSFKLENAIIEFEPGATAEFLAGLITTAVKDVIGEPYVILQAMGFLLMVASLYKATTIKLDEREATVFCGFARAPKKGDGGVKEEVILAHANAMRRAVSLKPLDAQELGNALYKLGEIKSVARVAGQPGTWRIVERHTVSRGK